jgi:hypothetical protein
VWKNGRAPTDRALTDRAERRREPVEPAVERRREPVEPAVERRRVRVVGKDPSAERTRDTGVET